MKVFHERQMSCNPSSIKGLFYEHYLIEKYSCGNYAFKSDVKKIVSDFLEDLLHENKRNS